MTSGRYRLLPGHPGVTGDFFGINTRLRMREGEYSVLKAPPLAVRRDEIEQDGVPVLMNAADASDVS